MGIVTDPRGERSEFRAVRWHRKVDHTVYSMQIYAFRWCVQGIEHPLCDNATHAVGDEIDLLVIGKYFVVL